MSTENTEGDTSGGLPADQAAQGAGPATEPEGVSSQPSRTEPEGVSSQPSQTEPEGVSSQPTRTEPVPEPERSQEQWGRVDDDGTVYVRTADGERPVGSWQVGDPDGALAYFRRKYEAIALEVDLLASRIEAGLVAPDEAYKAVRRERSNVENANAVGNLAGLLEKLHGLESVIEQRRAERRDERKRQQEEAKQTKVAITEEAEKLSAGSDWKHGVNRFRELLDQWKSLPRLDKQTDDGLWRRFSTARTAYTRRRKQHFAELNAKREESRTVKEQLAAEAEELAETTDWRRGADKVRDLMRRWKAAGAAPRDAEEQLWKRFRAAQDQFFAARTTAFAEQDAEQGDNLTRKRELLDEAERLLPVGDHRTARRTLRGILDRWDGIGRVPRNAVKEVESRMRKVEEAIRASEQKEWRRSNPETRARANDTLSLLRSAITDLERDVEKARDSGDRRAEAKAVEALEARRAWLAEVEKTADEFSG